MRIWRKLGFMLVLVSGAAIAGQPDPFDDLDRPTPKPRAKADPFEDLDKGTPKSNADPFDDLEKKPAAETSKAPPQKKTDDEDAKRDWKWRLFHENFAFKKEVYFQFSYSREKDRETDDFSDSVYSRQSVGFELQKKFSTQTSTVASFDVQGRLVRRDNFTEVQNDGEGEERDEWFFEYHNLYWDFYNVLNPVLDAQAKGQQLGRFNVRLGRFYLPFGLNLQSDTHGTILQLSNERNFGFERDWYAGLWGAVNQHLNYDIYYLLGSGYDISFKGQKGLIGGRVSLSNKYQIDYGLQGGMSVMYGERLSKHGIMRSPSVHEDSDGNNIIDTERLGLDWRYTRSVPTGSLTLSSELSVGRDESDNVFTQLHQLDYLTRDRHFGASVQYRRFWQDIGRGMVPANEFDRRKTDSSISGDLTWYFRNDLGNSNLHWIKLNAEFQLERQEGRRDTVISIQYYKYW